VLGGFIGVPRAASALGLLPYIITQFQTRRELVGSWHLDSSHHLASHASHWSASHFGEVALAKDSSEHRLANCWPEMVMVSGSVSDCRVLDSVAVAIAGSSIVARAVQMSSFM
jgi:hypothetical protein